MKNLILNTNILKGATYALLFCVLNLFSNQVFSQSCANCNAQYPAGTFNTTSNSLVTVNTCIYGGEWSNYSVTSGETYTWTTCGDASFDTQLTLTSGGCGGGFLAYNDDDCGLQSTITWTATFTGTVTLLVSRFNCANVSSCMTVQWACTTCGVTPPVGDYFQGTAFINNEKVGACLVTDCGPFIFADDGGTAGNYSNNIPGIYSPANAIYRVFCPDAAGNCMRATFTEFVTSNANDVMWVRNGPTEFSPNFTSGPTATTLWPSPPNLAAFDDGLFGNLSGSVPFSFQSTDASGCLTFAFVSNGAGNAAGWSATLECIPCAGGPNGTDNNDCQTMTALCSGTAVAGNSTGPGIVAEGCTGTACPAGGENHTNWYTFQAFTTGTLNITMTPAAGTDDYDFAIYGPNVTCAALGAPIRCTDSGVQGTTGLTGGAGDNTEDVTGDSFLNTMNVIAGETYILVVDEWSAGAGGGYNLSFGGSASLDCTILPVELVEFEAEYVPNEDVVDLFWKTESERDNDFFLVQRSTNGVDFEDIATVKGIGNSTLETSYYTVDTDPVVGTNYYRLEQFDINGNSSYSDLVSVNILADHYDIITVAPNPTKNVTEIIYNCYDEGESILKVYNAAGKIIEEKVLNSQPGSNRAELDLSTMRAGIYIITLNTNHKSYVSKVVKE